jgi:hypothetical protein
MKTDHLEKAGTPGGERRARRLGRWVQAMVLALLITAVVLRLLQLEQSLAFRYGGF